MLRLSSLPWTEYPVSMEYAWGSGERQERMDAGVSGVEFETYCRIASTVGKTARNGAYFCPNRPF